MTDLAAALEQLACALAPGPVLPTALASLLLEAGQPGVTTGNLAPLDFSRELAVVRLDDAVLPPENLLPDLRTDGVRDLAATLYAAEAAGVAAWCSGTAADYAKTRHQFGRPIGSFQAVKHLCATMACRAERAAALAWDAARAADEAPAGHPLAAAAAAALALDDAVDNAKDCIQVLGGIGFTWEHDAHLYLRRALALRQLLGGSPAWRTRAATLAATSAPSYVPAAQPEPAAAINAWAGPADRPIRHRGAAGTLRWPDAARRDHLVPAVQRARGRLDLASLRTRARRTDAGWLLTGQKVWTSLAREADWAIGLARTDPDLPKHEGITFFLVNMAAGGAVNPDYAERTGVHVATGQAVALLDQRGAHPAIRKLVGTAHRQAVAETALELLGPPGAAEGEASYEFLLTRCLSIAGGTTQILLNQVAERVLGLPR